MSSGGDIHIYDYPAKVFIRDIHLVQPDDQESNFYKFYHRKMRKVDIMGVITEVRGLHDAHLYRVDDGTGEIYCRYNHMNENRFKELRDLEHLQDLVADANFVNPCSLGEAMEYIVEESHKMYTIANTPLEQGNVAHVQGFISDFHGTRQVTAFRICKVSSFEDEIDRIYELSSLYSSCYNHIKD